MSLGLFPLSAGHGRGRELAGRREGGGRVVSRARARPGLRHLQQRLLGGRHSRSAHRGLYPAPLGWPAAFVAGRVGRLCVAGVLVAALPHSGGRATVGKDAEEAGPRRANSGLGPAAQPLRLVSFTVSKIFLDPVWYFYIFWFPEYLKRARGFDMAAIGKYAWIPFAVAGAGNFIGGAAFGFPAAPRRFGDGGAERLGDLLRRADGGRHSSRAGARSVGFHRAGFRCHDGLHGRAGEHALDAGRCLSQEAPSPRFTALASMGAGFGGMLFTLITGWVVDRYSYTPGLHRFRRACRSSARPSCGRSPGRWSGVPHPWHFNPAKRNQNENGSLTRRGGGAQRSRRRRQNQNLRAERRKAELQSG